MKARGLRHRGPIPSRGCCETTGLRQPLDSQLAGPPWVGIPASCWQNTDGLRRPKARWVGQTRRIRCGCIATSSPRASTSPCRRSDRRPCCRRRSLAGSDRPHDRRHVREPRPLHVGQLERGQDQLSCGGKTRFGWRAIRGRCGWSTPRRVRPRGREATGAGGSATDETLLHRHVAAASAPTRARRQAGLRGLWLRVRPARH